MADSFRFWTHGVSVMSVHVRFQPGMDRERQVTFAGAGAHFEERR